MYIAGRQPPLISQHSRGLPQCTPSGTLHCTEQKDFVRWNSMELKLCQTETESLGARWVQTSSLAGRTQDPLNHGPLPRTHGPRSSSCIDICISVCSPNAFAGKQGVITLSVDRHPWTGPVCSLLPHIPSSCNLQIHHHHTRCHPPPLHIIFIVIFDNHSWKTHPIFIFMLLLPFKHILLPHSLRLHYQIRQE